MDNDREGIAKELAAKDGQEFDGLDEVMRNAYLHNADGIIEQEAEAATVKKAEESGVPPCYYCKGETYVGGKPCPECNPVGLRKEEVYPEAEALPEVEKEAVGAEGKYEWEAQYEVVPPTAEEAETITEKPDEPDISGDRPDNQPAGSPDTGEPEQPPKPKAKKKARKRAK